MNAVLSTIRPYFKYNGSELAGTGTEPWWISEWMDYGDLGREPLMGLTKERGPLAGDLSDTAQQGSQVWAVNFYNEAGAVTLGKVFADPCSPSVPAQVLFAEGTVAIKFLFTDANRDRFTGQVAYLNNAPLYKAWIDAAGVGDHAPYTGRVERDVNLLQLDIAVKDMRDAKTGWVFGTYVWMGPTTGDGLYDNLVPAALIWADDEGVVNDQIKESWINPQLKNKIYGWAARPYLGFFGRGNGPADNILASCLSCHATARIPKSKFGIAAKSTDFSISDFQDATKVKAHVDKWFKNVPAGGNFNDGLTAVAALDYSLQLQSAILRMCYACQDGALDGVTPAICASANNYTKAMCVKKPLVSVFAAQKERLAEPLPRQ
jgi:hypothetical protein